MRSFNYLLILIVPSFLANAQRVSRSGRCGPAFGLTCKGSQYGDCCSQYGYCGSTNPYCGADCKIGWGTCKGSTSASPFSFGSHSSTPLPTSSIAASSTKTAASAAPSSSLEVSTDARCGKDGKGQTCLGSKWGSCCSQYSYCGSNTDYCGVSCQQGFGRCNSVSSSSARMSSLTSMRSFSTLATSSVPVSSSSTHSASAIQSATLSIASSVVPVRSSSASIAISSFSSTLSSSPVSSSALVASSMTVSSSTSPAASTTVETTSEPAASSATAPISTNLSASPSTSLAFSSVVSPSTASSLVPSPSCNPVSVNALRNPSFVTGFDEWEQTVSNDEVGSYGTADTQGSGHNDDSTYYYSVNIEPGFSIGRSTIKQSNVRIPSSSLVSCSGWARTSGGETPIRTWEIWVDGARCASYTTDTSSERWRQISGSPIIVQGDVHEVSVIMTAETDFGLTMYADDFAIMYNAGCT